jgi:hypothetical protein
MTGLEEEALANSVPAAMVRWAGGEQVFFIKCKWPNLICQAHASSCAPTLMGLPSLHII